LIFPIKPLTKTSLCFGAENFKTFHQKSNEDLIINNEIKKGGKTGLSAFFYFSVKTK
jgi:hypothetical protein